MTEALRRAGSRKNRVRTLIGLAAALGVVATTLTGR